MTTLAKLLVRKQQLIERLEKNPGVHEREEIERGAPSSHRSVSLKTIAFIVLSTAAMLGWVSALTWGARKLINWLF